MTSLIGRRILIVEDDPWVAKLLEFVVTDAGHVPLTARDGNEAFERFVEGMPDMAFIDVVLPRSDGLKLCRRIKDTALGTMIPIVAYSGIYRDKREATRVFGADAFLTKPFTPEQIGAQIKALLAPYAVAASGSAASPIKLAEGEVSLKQEPIARVVSRMYLDRKTGLLSVRSGAANKFFFFENGELVYARGSASVGGVGGLLLAMGRVSMAQLEPLERAARSQKGDRKHITQLVTEAGLVAPEEMRRLAVGQQLAEVFETFTWREGGLSFVEGPNDLKDAVVMGVDTASILQWGVRKMDPSIEDLDAITPRDALLQRSADADRRLKNLLLSVSDKQILGLIDGKKTVREIIGVAEMAGMDPVRALYTFLCTGAAVPGLAAENVAGSGAAPAEGREPLEGPQEMAGPFPMALMHLWRIGASGVLTCEGANTTFRVYVREGSPVFARTNREEDRLEAMLIRAGKLDPNVAWQALEQQKQRAGLRVGRILVEMGAITLEELHWAVKYQVQNIILSGFTWREGKFHFDPGPLPTEESITLDWDTPNAVLEGIRGLPMQSVSPLLPPGATLLERAPENGMVEERVKLNSYETKILSLVYGRQPLDQLLAMSFVTPREAHRAILVFLALGFLRPVGGALPAMTAAGPAPTLDLPDAGPAAVPEILTAPHGPHEDDEGEEVMYQASARTLEEEERIATETHSEEPGFTLFSPAPGAAPSPNAFAASAEPPSLEQLAAQFQTAQAPHPALHPPQAEPAPAHPPGREGASTAPTLAGEEPPAGWTSPTADMVPRWLYEELQQEKKDLEKRFWALLDERKGGEENERDVVPRADYDALLEEKKKLQEKLMQVLDELLDLRSRARDAARREPDRDQMREPIPFPRGGRKPGEGA